MVATQSDILARVRKLCDVRGIPIKPSAKLGVFSSFGDGAEVKSAGKDDVLIKVMLTTSDLDMDQERILPDGVDVTTYLMKNRNFFVDHEYDALRCVGKIRDMRRKGNGWAVDVVMMNRDTNPYTQAIIAWAEHGSAPTSIGFEETEAGPPTPTETKDYPNTRWMIRKCVALEGSFTAIPCNVSCQSQAVVYGNFGEEKRAGLREILVKSKAPLDVIRALVPEAKPKRRVVLCE